MKWLPKNRQNPFIIVVLATVALLALIYFGLINSQKAELSQIARNRQKADDKLKDIENTIRNASVTTSHLAAETAALSDAEADMASGDLYSWTYGTMRSFKQQYKVEIPEIGPPRLEEEDLFPKFPYKQISFNVTGKAFYHDLGKFVADFENTFPHARLVNVVITPVGGESEQLSFSMDVVALVKPNAS